MKNIQEQTLASIVSDNHKVVPVLEKYNLDFCCKGKRTLAQACAENGIKISNITDELEFLNDGTGKQQMPFTEMDAEQLISHIVTHHHFYIKQTAPTIAAHLQKVATKHGDRFPFMRQVNDLFGILTTELSLHMEEEEKTLFPRIREVDNLVKSGKSAQFVSANIDTFINLMEADHNEAGNIMYEIRRLTNNYTPPQDACTTFRITLAELKEFEQDLHKHVHLENNILFPRIYNEYN